MKRIKFFASILLMLCLSVVCCAQTKIDWKQIKNIPDTLEFKNVLLEHLLFKSAYQPVMESIHMGGIYYDNMTERMRIYENGQWRDLSVTIASDSIGAPLTILGYLQANDIYASNTAYIKNGVLATGTSVFDRLKVNNALKVPTVTNTSLGVGSIYYDTSANKLKVLNSSNQWKVVSVDVDSALSTTSTNPVQNKAITAKINQTDANLINGMATTLQQSYNYANGIATQAYNYADSAATDAETASKNYADLQVRLLNSTISEKLASGTSDLNVNSVKARNASFTDNLQLPFFTGQLGNGLLAYDSSQKHLVLTYREDVNQYASKAIADKHYVDRNYVSDVATSTVNGTITVTKNGVSTNVAVKGLGSAAYTDVDSVMNANSPNPVQNGVIKSYVDSMISGGSSFTRTSTALATASVQTQNRISSDDQDYYDVNVSNQNTTVIYNSNMAFWINPSKNDFPVRPSVAGQVGKSRLKVTIPEIISSYNYGLVLLVGNGYSSISFGTYTDNINGNTVKQISASISISSHDLYYTYNTPNSQYTSGYDVYLKAPGVVSVWFK